MLRFAAVALACLALIGPASADDSSKNHRHFLEFYEGVNQGNLGVIDELVADDYVEHEVYPGLDPGKAGLRQFFEAMLVAFPDLKFDVHFTMEDGDLLSAYMTMSGTQKGEFMGMPATGRRFETRLIDIVRMRHGKAVEHWGVTDTGIMMEQILVGPDEAQDES